MIAHGIPIFIALEPVDMRLGAERLGALVREKMQAEPRSRALFVFVGKRGHTMKVLTWDGTGREAASVSVTCRCGALGKQQDTRTLAARMIDADALQHGDSIVGACTGRGPSASSDARFDVSPALAADQARNAK